MPKKTWKIDESDGPSPRQYQSELAAYHARYAAWLRGVVRDIESASPDAPPISIGTQMAIAMVSPDAPQPPSASEIASANAPNARKAIRGARRELIAAGVDLAPLGLGGSVRDLLAVDLIAGGVEQQALLRWAADGLSYVKALPSERAPILAERLTEAVVRGDRWETIRGLIAEEMGTEGSDAAEETGIEGSPDAEETGIVGWHLDLIAQDQVAKLNGRITQDMHAAAGVTHYRWLSSKDGRVRKSHREADGNVYSWAEGAPGVGFYDENGHPGQCGRCRCVAIPVVGE